MESPFGYSQEHKNEAAVEEKKVEDTTVQDSTPVEEIENL